MYMGGNGFYWRIANSEAIPDVIEVRRAEGGIRAWPAEPGEAYHQLDGGYGGLWRRNGRPPQMLAGVGFTAQGLFEGSYYRRLRRRTTTGCSRAWTAKSSATKACPAAVRPGSSWTAPISASARPPNATILARSEKHQPHFIAVPEELLSHVNTVTGERPGQPDPRRDRHIRDREWRRGVRDRVDHLLWQPAGERLRQQGRARHRQRPAAVHEHLT